MLLQCETEDGVPGEGASLVAGWLHPETLESLLELNELCLALLAEQAAARTAQASLLLREVGELWRVLDAAARQRAATCPYLLVDAGFADPLRWRQPAAVGVGDAGQAAYTCRGRPGLRGWCSRMPGTWPARRAPPHGCCSA